ncbi:MAG: FG-GAP-like repeat-containing protein [Candidatus Zixiibacteriota bacterium]
MRQKWYHVVWLLCVASLSFNEAALGDFMFDRTDYSAGLGPIDVVSADFDGDGDIDLAVLNSVVTLDDKSLYMMWNDGGGGFTIGTRYALNCPQDVVAGDFDYDGDMDLAISDDNKCWAGTSGRVVILVNDGTGSFNQGDQVLITGLPSGPAALSGLSVGDFNGDGLDDLAVAALSAGKVLLATNNGSADFEVWTELTISQYPAGLAADDFDRDGDWDIAIGHWTTGVLTVLVNSGSGVFTSTTYPVGDFYGVYSGDLNHDGFTDLACGNSHNDWFLVLMNDGHGSFDSRSVPVSGYTAHSICPIDLDGDTDLDLAITASTYRVAMFENDGTGEFEPAGFVVLAENPYAGAPMGLCGADFDGDDDNDLAVANYYRGLTSVLLNFRPVITVALDIKPGSCPNPLNVTDSPVAVDASDDKFGFNSGGDGATAATRSVLPVAILGAADFDVTTIDHTTVRLAGVTPTRGAFADVASPADRSWDECECTTSGADGYVDLTLKFDKATIVAALGPVEDGIIIPLALTGNLLDGTPIEGYDCVVIVGAGRKPLTGRPDVRSPLPSTFALAQNYPNPFNPATEITFALPVAADVRLDIFNVLGQKVATLIEQRLEAGEHRALWDASDQPSGVYLYRLTAGEFVESKKMLLLK